MADYKIGAKIVLDGEAEFRSAVNNSKASLKSLESELKLCSAQFAGQEKSMEELRKKQTIYQRQQEQLQKTEKLYTEQLTKANSAYDKASKTHKKTGEAVDELRKKLDSAKKVYGENSEEVQSLTTELAAAEKQYTKEEVAITNLETKMAKYSNDLNETKLSLVAVDNELKTTNHNLENFDEYVKEAGDSSEDASGKVDKVQLSISKLVSAELIASMVKKLAGAIVDLAKASIDVGSSFEASMSNVEALSGATGEALESLSKKAKEMGAQTIYSATESADAMSYMALAGWNTEQMLEGIEPILNMAAAANMDLATASDIVTDYITAFGLEAKDAAHMADLMAYAMANSNTTVELLGESYKNCAATAGSMGISVEEVTAALATMANAGVKGGEAGTALNTILTRLATNTKDCADKLAEYGVDIYDTEGTMKSLSSILDEMSGFWAELTDQEQANLAKTIAGTQQYSKFQTIMLGVSEAAKEGGQSFLDYRDALRDCDGAAVSMATTMQNNLKGKITILKSALEGLGISVYDVFDETLKDAVDAATDSVTGLNSAVSSGNLGVSLNKLSQGFSKLALSAVEFARDALPDMIDGLTWLVNNLGDIGTLAKAGASAWVAYKVAVKAAEIAQKGFNATMFANPIAAIAAAAAACTAIIIDYAKGLGDVAKHASDATIESDLLAKSLADTNDEIERGITDRKSEREALETNADVAHTLVGRLEDMQEAYANGSDNMTEMKMVVDELNEAVPGLNLAIDENTGILNKNTDAINADIDALVKYQKVQAAQNDLNIIASDQYELEKNSVKIKQQLVKQQEEIAKAQKKYDDELKAGNELQGENVNLIDEAALELQNAQKVYEDLEEQQRANEEAMEDLGEEYQWVTEYINENTEAFDTVNDGMASNEESIEETKEALDRLNQAYSDAYDEAMESINGQLGLFEELSNESDLSVQQMGENLDKQAEIMNQYAADLQIAAGLAESGLMDDGLLGALKTLGLDGAGYLHELVTSAETDRDAFQKTMDSWASMEEAKSALAGQLAEMETNYTETYNTLTQTTQDSETAQQVSADNMLILWQKYGVDLKNQLNTTATEAGTAGGEIGTKTVDATSEALDIVGSSSQKAKDLGKAYGTGFVEGIEDKYEAAKKAGKGIVDVTAEATAAAQDSHSPSKLAQKLGTYFGEGYAIGINDSMTKATKMLNKALPNEKNIKVSSSVRMQQDSAGSVAQLVNILNKYLPEIKPSDTRVNISLEGDAKQIFKKVKVENRKETKATGNNPMINN